MIRRLQQFLRLDAADKKLFAQVWLRLLQVRIKLWTSTYKETRSWLEKRASVGSPVKSDQQHAETIARFVSAASRFVPEASCLTQALAGESLLRGSGLEPSLHIGVKKDNNDLFEAHAWLELGEIKLIGGPASSEFSRFQFDMPNVPKRQSIGTALNT